MKIQSTFLVPGNVLGIRESKIKRWGLYPKGASSLIGNTHVVWWHEEQMDLGVRYLDLIKTGYLFSRKKSPELIYLTSKGGQNLLAFTRPSALSSQKLAWGTSLVVQWLRIYLPMQRTLSLIPGQGTKIPTCHRATKPMRYKEELVCHTKGKKNRRNMLVNDAFLWVSPWGWYMKTRKSI